MTPIIAPWLSISSGGAFRWFLVIWLYSVRSHLISCEALLAAMYSGANVESTTVFMRRDVQHIGFEPCCIMYPYLDCLVSGQLAKSASEAPSIIESPFINHRSCFYVCFRYRAMCLRLFQCLCVGLLLCLASAFAI